MKQTKSAAGRSRFVTGVDGLRAIAVMAVICYHLLPNFLKGGYLGVPLFLLISGYFVTNQLAVKIDRQQPIHLLGYWRHRFARLYPPLVGMLLATSAYITLFSRANLTHLRAVVLTNLTWVYNWWAVSHGQSYFDQFNAPSPFTHLWTLGVEAQFYLLWPPLLIWGLKKLGRRKMARVTLGLALVSALLMAVLFNPQHINRVYYGTDTRAFSLLLGSFLGLAWPRERLKANLPAQAQRGLEITAGVTLLITLIGFATLDGQAAITYRGGMFFYSLVGMVLLATIVHPGARVNAWLTNPVFHYLGQRSYGIYIYQLPVMVFYEAHFPVGAAPILNAVIETAIILGLSELSYRLVELPAKRQFWRHLHRPANWRQWTVSISGGVVVAVAVIGLASPAPKASKPALQRELTHNKQATAERNKLIAAGKTPKVNVNSKSLRQKYQLTAKQLKQISQLKITAIGDSVMVGASDALQELAPKTYVDAQVGRQASSGAAVIKSLAKKGKLQSIVVINLGTNGTISAQSAKEICAAVGTHRQLYWITPHIPTKTWQSTVVKQIKQVAKDHSNVHVIDWQAQSKDHRQWFGKDQVHMNATGDAQYARLIMTTILKEEGKN